MTDDARKAWQRPGFIIAVVVILLVLALGITALVRSLGQPDQEPTASPTTSTSTESAEPTETTSPSETTEPTPTDNSVCGLEAVELEGTLEAAPDTSWTYIGAVGVPSVEGQGPGTVAADGLRTCFARTPTGAVLSAANMTGQLAAPSVQEEAVRYFIAQGPGYDAAVSMTTESQSSPSIDLQVTGFKLLDYTGDEALVDVAVEATGNGITTYNSFRTPLTWQDGDWRQVPTADGQQQYPPVQLPNTADYIAWSAN